MVRGLGDPRSLIGTPGESSVRQTGWITARLLLLWSASILLWSAPVTAKETPLEEGGERPAKPEEIPLEMPRWRIALRIPRGIPRWIPQGNLGVIAGGNKKSKVYALSYKDLKVVVETSNSADQKKLEKALYEKIV